MELSIEQQLASYTDKKNVLVISSAGGGKTRCLTERVKYLITEKQVSPSDIYCITFTNMAAEEMKIRLGAIVEKTFIGTIHSLANKILLQNQINTFDLIEQEKFDGFFELLNEHKDKIIFPPIKHLLVDEFQDIGDKEYDFMRLMLKPQNFWAVGDSRQSIFGFRGVNYHIFMNLTEDPYTDVYELRDCYRCDPEIIDFANSQIRKVKHIYKTPTNCIKKHIDGAVQEEEFSYAALLDIVNEMYEIDGNYKNTAILCRSNKMIDDIMFFLDHNGVPNMTFKKGEKTYSELQQDIQNDSVKILTIHSAKGLEWKNVIVVQEFMPWNDEECRINYVAATRAIDNLFWLYPPKKKKRTKTSNYKQQYIEKQMVGW